VRFYLGTHELAHMERTDVPLFVSRRRLERRRRLPEPRGPWALDSGGFSELSMYGAWQTTAEQYAVEVRRWNDGMPGLQWAACMDWMTEPWILEKTGLSVADHQRRTIDSLHRLRDLEPGLPWAPVLQGWTLRDYLRHVEMYEAAGVDLRAEPVVGVGSVCRRQHTSEVAGIIGTLAGLGLRLHGFGLKTSGLARVARLLASADSMAWSSHARRRPALPGCTHRSCANCLRYALRWRENVLSKIDAAPLGLFDRQAA
jgi:hypothetical protein